MATKRKIEVFSAGCPACEEAIALVNRVACASCEVEVLDMRDANVAERAKRYGVKQVPAVLVDGQLAECCKSKGVTEADLRSAGVGAG
jgi:glutaredoxin 3